MLKAQRNAIDWLGAVSGSTPDLRRLRPNHADKCIHPAFILTSIESHCLEIIMKVLVAFSFIIAVIAGPVTQKQEVLRSKHARCASIEDYTVQWFIENAPKEKRPAPSTCLFYTYKLTGKARWYARLNGMTTIWVSGRPLNTPAWHILNNTGCLARRLL